MSGKTPNRYSTKKHKHISVCHSRRLAKLARNRKKEEYKPVEKPIPLIPEDPYTNIDKKMDKYIVPINRQQYTEFLVRIKYFGLSPNDFVRGVIELFLEDDEDLEKCIRKLLEAQPSIKRLSRVFLDSAKKLKKKYKKILDTELAEEEKEKLYRFSEKESPGEL